MRISKDDHEGWLASTVTREVKSVMIERREKIKEAMASDTYLNREVEHGIAVGRCEEIDDFVYMTYEDMLPKGE